MKLSQKGELIFIHFSWLVVFYGISTLMGYLMPNPFYSFKLYMYDL